jgi:uncharacterized membrane protein YeaQ/YmgE (transglycosylase-associated protein family)
MDISTLILWLIIGGIAGWLASIVMKTNRQQGLFMDIVVGIVGSFIGGFLFSLFATPGVTGATAIGYQLVVAFVGALVLLAIARALSGRDAIPR